MDARSSSLHQLLLGEKEYIIPVFQRYYSWKKKNWQQLWTDMEVLLDPEDESRRHFMGPLVFVPQRSSVVAPRYLVIDGQQRLLTLSVFLCAIRNIARRRNYASLAHEIQEKYLVDKYRQGIDQLRILPRQLDRGDYISIVLMEQAAGGSLHKALSFFTDRLNALENCYAEPALNSLMKTAVTGLEFVVVTLGDENPYEIFSSLNATGVPLSEADLIRNFVFMHLEPEAIDAFDTLHWQPLEDSLGTNSRGRDSLTPFFRDFLMRNGKYVSPRAVFSAFERHYSDGPFDAPTLAEDLTTCAGYYRVLLSVDSARPGLEKPLRKLLRLESSTAYPLLLNLFERVHAGDMLASDYAAAVEMLAGFILRRIVCQQSSRAYGRWFVSACGQLGDSPLQGLRLFLEERGFPADERFRRAFVSYDLYHSAYARSVLLEIESELSKGHKEPPDLSQTTIEHVMPQTLTGPWVEDLGDDSETIHGEWLHTVGNLTLSAYNSELWNGPFSSKRSIYRDSNVSMNREICLAESWTRDEIVARGERLAELAVHIWPGPREETSLGLPASASSDVADHDGLYAQYWDAFLFSLQTAGSELSPIATASGDRLKVDIGQESCELAAEISAGSSRVVGLALTLTGPNRYETYRALLRNRAEIEGEVGRWLYWWGRPKEVDSRISMYMAYANPADRSRWPEQHEWLRENLEVMARSFGPRLSGAA